MKIWLQKKALYIFIIENWSIRIWLILQNGYMHVWKSQNINRILNLNPNKFDGFWYIHHKTLSTSLIVVWIHHKQNVDRRYRRRYLSSVEIWIWTINAFNALENNQNIKSNVWEICLDALQILQVHSWIICMNQWK